MKIHSLTWQQASQLSAFILPEVLELPDLENFCYLAAAETGRGILGLAVIDPRADGPLLLSIAVSPTARREGVASRLLEAAVEVLRSNGGATLTVEHSMAPEDWPALDNLLEKNGFFQTEPERCAYQIPLAKLAAHPVLAATHGHTSPCLFPMSNLSPVQLRAFRMEMQERELFAPAVLQQCDSRLSFFWLEDGHVQACLLMVSPEDGVLVNLWTYLSASIKNKQALLHLFAAGMTAAQNTMAPDTQVFFSCQNEASDHLIHHFAPHAAPVQIMRVYTRATAPEEDVLPEVDSQPDDSEPDDNAAVTLEERAERWADVQFTPVTEVDPTCRNCAHRIPSQALSCRAYQRKPGPVFYGEPCPSFSPVQ